MSTDEKTLAESLAAEALDSIAEGVIRLDAALRFTYLNPAAARMLGRPRDLIVGKSLGVEFPELEMTALATTCLRAMSMKSEAAATEHFAAFDVWLDVRARPSHDGVLVFLRESTELARLRIKHDRAEAELRTVSDTVPAFLAYVDTNETYRFVNRLAETWFGMPNDALIGLHFSAGLSDEDFEGLRGHLTAALAGEAVESRRRLSFATGVRWVDVTFVPHLRDGVVAGTMVMALDVTDRHLAEVERLDLTARLKANEARLRRFYDSGVVGVLHWRRDGAIVDANESFLRMVGYRLEDLRAGRLDWRKLTPPDFEALDRAAIAEMDTRGICTPFEKELIHAEGRRVAVLMGEAFLDGSTTEGIAWVHDNTGRKQVEERQALLLAAGRVMAASSLDAEQTMTEVTRLLTRDYGEAAFIDLVHDGGAIDHRHISHRDPEAAAVIASLRKQFPEGPNHPVRVAAREGRGSVVDLTEAALTRAGVPAERRELMGTYQPRSVVLSPLKARGRVLAVLSVASSTRAFDDDDLAMVEELARQLGTSIDNARLFEAAGEARRFAEETSRVKDEFLAMVSHELRTPLNAILGWTSLLQAGALGEAKRTQAIDVIDRNARAQAQIIEELLDISRIITGKLRLDVKDVSVGEVVEAAVDALRPAADGKGVRLTHVIDTTVGAVMGDPERLRQVIYNLLTNAVRHTPRAGRVQVTVTKRETQIEIRVDDTGEGIPAELVPHVFERFRQGEGGTTRRYGGLGLGLAIVKHIVELHGGTIQVSSDGLGRGASFRICIPIAAVRAVELRRGPAPIATRGSPTAADAAALEGLLVLVVDDDDDTREVLTVSLEIAGAQVVAAKSAADAFESLCRNRPAVILSDIGMPSEDGYSFIERIRRLPEEHGGKTPAVALTAFARLEDRTKALLAGYTMHLAKPVDVRELVVVVAAVAGRVSPA